MIGTGCAGRALRTLSTRFPDGWLDSGTAEVAIRMYGDSTIDEMENTTMYMYHATAPTGIEKPGIVIGCIDIRTGFECPLCNKERSYPRGLAFFLTNGEIVCHECAEDHAPKLYATFEAHTSPLSRHKARLLREAQDKGVEHVYQIDGWIDQDVDNPFEPDRDGDLVFHHFTDELRRSSGDLAVRVHVHEDVLDRPEVVLRVLKKIRKTLRSNLMCTGGRTLALPEDPFDGEPF